MKNFFFLLVLLISLTRVANAQTGAFSVDTVIVPPYICQANTFDVVVLGLAANGNIRPGPATYAFSNDTVFVQFYFISGAGPATPTPIGHSITIPAPSVFGHYKIEANIFDDGVLFQNLTSSIAICAGVSGVSVHEELNENQLIYPNPATDHIQVQLPVAETATVILTDLTGRTVLTQQISAGNQRVDLAGLAKGTYVLKLETKNGLSVQKIVKQ